MQKLYNSINEEITKFEYIKNKKKKSFIIHLIDEE